jgi:hypothetical protein
MSYHERIKMIFEFLEKEKRMILFRCILCPTWRHIAYTSIKTLIRNQTSTSPFSNVEKSLSHNLLVFEYKDRILPLLGAIGLVQFIALDFVAYWSFYLFGTVTAKEENLTTESTLIERAATIVPTNRFRYTTNGIIVLLSKFRNHIFLFDKKTDFIKHYEPRNESTVIH